MKSLLLCLFTACSVLAQAQLNPAITSWLQNTSETGTYYVEGNSDLLDNSILVNCQKVEYSDDFVYVTATGIPAYPTGPFLDRNPSFAENQESIFQIPLNPTQNTGTLDETVGGNIGIFINGVALFDYRDGVAWDPTTQSLCGGPGNDRCPGGPNATQDWTRDAIPAEMPGFDCSKGHPAMGNYHHHQNPSAFKLDLETVSTVCNLYDADGLYAIDSTEHAPLIGYAYDGFPIYGAYGFANADGTGGVTRILSGYQLRNITERTTKPDGTASDAGPGFDGDYFLGYFREDYEFVDDANNDAVLDEHNGRICITPEYPNGTYAYFATVNADWTSAYPYAVGPTFYGNFERRNVMTVDEMTTVYDATSTTREQAFGNIKFNVLPNPVSDLVAVQVDGLVSRELTLELVGTDGKSYAKTRIPEGGTLAHFDVQTLYPGTYYITIADGVERTVRTIVVER
ncbi:MAG: YHYH protein [Saprospiraceae bacterium]